MVDGIPQLDLAQHEALGDHGEIRDDARHDALTLERQIALVAKSKWAAPELTATVFLPDHGADGLLQHVFPPSEHRGWLGW